MSLRFSPAGAPVAHDLLDLVDAVATAVAVEAVAGASRCGASAAAALRRSPQITAQSITRSMLVSSRIVSSLEPVIVSALLVRRNSSAAICLPSISSVNLRLQTSAVRQAPNAAAGAARRHLGIAVAAGVEKVLRPDVNLMGADVAAMI